MYLDPIHVDTIDEMAKLAGVPRSEIVRDVVSLITTKYAKLILKPKKMGKNIYAAFNKIIGIGKIGDPEAYLKVDEIYFR
jgi:hypothetical protein